MWYVKKAFFGRFQNREKTAEKLINFHTVHFKHECQKIGSKQISSWSSTSFLRLFLDTRRFVAFNDPKTERQVKKSECKKCIET